MLTLLKNLECYCPDYAGKKDILIANDKILRLLPAGEFAKEAILDNVYDCDGLTAYPGLIDQHVHILGGGGEQGFASRIPEIDIKEILMAGVATVVGLLGADSCTRSLECLYAKAKALENQGITTYIYTGSYTVPPVTFTGSTLRDLVFIDKVIGTGEIAISDHRSSNPTVEQMLKVASDTHLGGLLGGKAGVVHLHLGDGKERLKLLFAMVQNSDLPIEQFVPTHVNRKPELFDEAVEYCRGGGHIDLTAGETAGIPVPEAVRRLKDSGVDMSLVTLSSDAGGSVPGGGVCRMGAVFEDLKHCLDDKTLRQDEVIRLMTENVAKLLKIYPKKGTLKEDSDADILICDVNHRIVKLFCMGKLMIDGGNVIV